MWRLRLLHPRRFLLFCLRHRLHRLYRLSKRHGRNMVDGEVLVAESHVWRSKKSFDAGRDPHLVWDCELSDMETLGARLIGIFGPPS